MSIIRRPWASGTGDRIAKAYSAVSDILGKGGAQFSIVPIGDLDDEPVDRASVTSRGSGGGAGHVFTYSEPVTSFDIPPTLANALVPVIHFNGTDEDIDAPDHAWWTVSSGGVDEAFSVGLWLNVTNSAATRIAYSKWSGVGNTEEWLFQITTADKLQFAIGDASVSIAVWELSDSAITQGVYELFVGTYDGRGGADAADGMAILNSSGIIAATPANNNQYVDMEDVGETIKIGSGAGAWFKGSMYGGPLGPFLTKRQLSTADILALGVIGKGLV